MDREQPHRVGALLLGDGLELAGADGFLVAHEADEALDIRAAQLLVGSCEPGKLAQVRVAAPSVPLREHREVVVVLRDDPLAQPLERESRRQRCEPVIALPESAQKACVPLGHRLRNPAVEPGEQRPLRRRASEQDERVVRHADKGRREDAHERLVVVPVMEQPQVREQVDDLLLAEVALPGRAIGRNAEGAELLLVPLRVGTGSEEEHGLARRRGTRVE